MDSKEERSFIEMLGRALSTALIPVCDTLRDMSHELEKVNHNLEKVNHNVCEKVEVDPETEKISRSGIEGRGSIGTTVTLKRAIPLPDFSSQGFATLEEYYRDKEEEVSDESERGRRIAPEGISSDTESGKKSPKKKKIKRMKVLIPSLKIPTKASSVSVGVQTPQFLIQRLEKIERRLEKIERNNKPVKKKKKKKWVSFSTMRTPAGKKFLIEKRKITKKKNMMTKMKKSPYKDSRKNHRDSTTMKKGRKSKKYVKKN